MDLQGKWWVAHTKGRFEKAFAWDLVSRDIGHFLPLVERVRFSGGKKRHVMLPLFASYVFFCGTEQDRYKAMATNRLCQTIEVVDQEQLISELLAIHLALQNKVHLNPYPCAAVGRACRVIAGPFIGVEGTVVSRSKAARLVLQIGILGQGAAMEIDVDFLEAID